MTPDRTPPQCSNGSAPDSIPFLRELIACHYRRFDVRKASTAAAASDLNATCEPIGVVIYQQVFIDDIDKPPVGRGEIPRIGICTLGTGKPLSNDHERFRNQIGTGVHSSGHVDA